MFTVNDGLHHIAYDIGILQSIIYKVYTICNNLCGRHNMMNMQGSIPGNLPVLLMENLKDDVIIWDIHNETRSCTE